MSKEGNTTKYKKWFHIYYTSWVRCGACCDNAIWALLFKLSTRCAFDVAVLRWLMADHLRRSHANPPNEPLAPQPRTADHVTQSRRRLRRPWFPALRGWIFSTAISPGWGPCNNVGNCTRKLWITRQTKPGVEEQNDIRWLAGAVTI